jgi:hypothetical protein
LVSSKVLVVALKWTYIGFFVFGLLVMFARISKSLRAVNAQKNIFGANKGVHRIGVISNLGYALVALLLSLYFLLLYLGSEFSTPIFVVMLFLLLIALILDAAFKKRS